MLKSTLIQKKLCRMLQFYVSGYLHRACFVVNLFLCALSKGFPGVEIRMTQLRSVVCCARGRLAWERKVCEAPTNWREAGSG